MGASRYSSGSGHDRLELAAPAITYAEQGIVVSPAEHRAIENHAERLGRYPASAAIFLPGGAPLRPGDILRQTDLARSLALIARGGPDAFYRGEIALAIESFLGERRRTDRGRFRGPHDRRSPLPLPPPTVGTPSMRPGYRRRDSSSSKRLTSASRRQLRRWV